MVYRLPKLRYTVIAEYCSYRSTVYQNMYTAIIGFQYTGIFSGIRVFFPGIRVFFPGIRVFFPVYGYLFRYNGIFPGIPVFSPVYQYAGMTGFIPVKKLSISLEILPSTSYISIELRLFFENLIHHK